MPYDCLMKDAKAVQRFINTIALLSDPGQRWGGGDTVKGHEGRMWIITALVQSLTMHKQSLHSVPLMKADGVS